MDPYVERSLVSGGLLVPSLYTSHIVYVFLKVYDFDCSNSVPPLAVGSRCRGGIGGVFWGMGGEVVEVEVEGVCVGDGEVRCRMDKLPGVCLSRARPFDGR